MVEFFLSYQIDVETIGGICLNLFVVVRRICRLRVLNCWKCYGLVSGVKRWVDKLFDCNLVEECTWAVGFFDR